MKKVELGDYFMWNGQVVQCQWINEGHKSIGFKTVETIICPHCKEGHQMDVGHDVIESSPNFQNGAEQVKTISG